MPQTVWLTLQWSCCQDRRRHVFSRRHFIVVMLYRYELLLVFLPRQRSWGGMLWDWTQDRASMVWKTWFLLNMAHFGYIFVKFLGGRIYSKSYFLSCSNKVLVVMCPSFSTENPWIWGGVPTIETYDMRIWVGQFSLQKNTWPFFLCWQNAIEMKFSKNHWPWHLRVVFLLTLLFRICTSRVLSTEDSNWWFQPLRVQPT